MILTDEQIVDAIKSVCRLNEPSFADALIQYRAETIAMGRAVERALLSASKPAATEGWKLVPDHANADAIVTSLYRRFKDWSKRGFGPDDVTWCEVKADVLSMLAASPAAPAQSGEPVAWRYLTPTGWHATTKMDKALGASAHHDMEPLYAAPQPSPAAQSVETCKCRRLGDWKGFHHPLCDKAPAQSAVAQYEFPRGISP